MGFDFSTQQLKAVIINSSLEVLQEEAVKFDDLSNYKTTGGCHVNQDGLTVTSPTIMWVEALDLLLGKMKSSGADFSKIQALSGAGQQHGSVYWKTGAEERLKNLDSTKSLEEQLSSLFSVNDSPIWMDSSTTEQCKKLENVVGGAQVMADITGSRAYERFTVNQILKIIERDPDAYKATERISLVSSFGATLFRGEYCNIDESDASGMNLLNIKSRAWEKSILDACAPDLASKLGEPVPSITVQGSISKYYVDRYGFSPECKVVSFTGDNPASLAGMRLADDDIAVSLGSSDVLFLWLKEPIARTEGHVFVNPVDTEAYMALLCFKNGSLTREAIRDEHCNKTWDEFARLMSVEPMGNNGNIGLYYTIAEIIPSNIEGCYYFNQDNSPVESLSPSQHARAVIEGQFLSRRIHAEDMGFRFGASSRILATGGASNNQSILQAMSDVFNAPVYTQEVANSASLGGAMLAMHAVNVKADGISYQERLRNGPEFKLAATPQAGCKEVYDTMAARYRHLEQTVTTAS